MTIDCREHEIKLLNGLIETTLDSIDGYHRAAQISDCRRFRAVFMDRVGERELVVSRLRERVRELGATPEEDGSILAKTHRAFLTMRDRVDENAVIAEVDHGESFLAGKWQQALDDQALSAETRRLIRGYCEAIRRGQQEWRREHVAGGSSATVSVAMEAAGERLSASRRDDFNRSKPAPRSADGSPARPS